MKTALTIALLIQLVSGLVWTLAVAGTPGRGDFGLLALLLLVYACQLPGVLLGAWSLWRHPELRVRAGLSVASPVVFWFLPGIVKALSGGHLDAAEAMSVGLALLGALLAASVIAPRRVAAQVPAFLFRSNWFNGLLLTLNVLAWVAVIAVVFLVVSGALGSPSGSTGYALASAIVLAAVFLIGMGAGSLLLFAWALLSLRSGVDGACRRLNVAQLIVATPSMLLGMTALLFLASQRYSPG
ncbi:MAG: hypothetical protein AAFX10_14335 [Pseudomonadota bacterium]